MVFLFLEKRISLRNVHKMICVQGSVQKGSRGQTFTFPFTEFHTIGLTTSERLSNLIVYACYEPSGKTRSLFFECALV